MSAEVVKLLADAVLSHSFVLVGRVLALLLITGRVDFSSKKLREYFVLLCLNFRAVPHVRFLS